MAHTWQVHQPNLTWPCPPGKVRQARGVAAVPLPYLGHRRVLEQLDATTIRATSVTANNTGKLPFAQYILWRIGEVAKHGTRFGPTVKRGKGWPWNHRFQLKRGDHQVTHKQLEGESTKKSKHPRNIRHGVFLLSLPCAEVLPPTKKT